MPLYLETNMNTDENLKRQLAAWKVDVEVPARFQANVWAQIAAQESARRSVWDRLSDWLGTVRYQPQLAMAVLIFGLTLSVGTAYVQAQDSNARAGRQLEARYMESINPLARTSHSK